MMGYIGNAPYQGVLTGGNIQDGTVETTDLANGAVTTVKLGDGQVTAGKLAATLDLTGKTVTLPAGVGGHASGTEANRPAAPAIGTIYFNTDEDTLQQYTSAGWENIGVIPPAISSVSGTIYNTIATNLTISGSAFGVGATVRFAYGGSTSDVAVTPTSDIEITVAVPSAVYNQVGGTSVTISVIASGQVSNGSSKTVQAIPTGGTITTSGGYRIHTFTSSSSFVVPSGAPLSNVEYLVIAGGGGGGNRYSGGGAGGYRCSVVGESSGGGLSAEARLTLSANSYTVTIGSGGAGGTVGNASSGQNGFNSVFGPIESIGGGKGAPNGTSAIQDELGKSGGSGGGSNGDGYDRFLLAGGAGTSGQGFAGGNGWSQSANNNGGGGGGAGQAGGSATSGSSGPHAGGNGVSSSINGTATTRAGGGGGARQVSNALASGGAGGGGAGGGFHGETNKGAGGGCGNDGVGGSGGSGIVIVRYQF
jgi:hypothetical protein